MALRVTKKDVKKSSYYVWFLGAQEARSATGAKQALAALTRLEARAASTANPASPPTKVTLQVSGRGLKIVQNVAGRTVKHLLPADSVTEARSRGDAVVCILLLYNPATRCPLHAHAYRCDSEQTAQALCTQLRAIAGLGPEEEDEPDLPDDNIPSDIDSRNDIELPRYSEKRHGSNERSGSYDKRIEPRISSRGARVDNRNMRNDPRDGRTDHRDSRDPRDSRIDPRDPRDRIDSRDPRIDPRESRIDNRDHIIDPRDIRHGSHENRVPPVEMRLAPEQEIVAEKLAAELRTRLAGREPLLLPPRDYDTNRRVLSAVPQVVAKRNTRTAVVGSSAGSSGIGSDLAPSPERPHTSSEEDWGESTAYMMHEGYDVSLSPPRRPRSPSPTKPLLRAAGSVSPKDRFHVAKEKFMNLEREKLNEEIEKRAQMRRNLNNILSRGPLTPSELKLQNERRSKWDDEDEDFIERRPEMPRAVARPDHRDRWGNGRDERDLSRGRDVKEVRDFRDSRHFERGSRDLRDPMDMRELRDQRPIRDEREYREVRENRDVRESRDVRDSRDYRESRDYKEHKDVRDPRYSREIADPRNIKDLRERDYKEVRDPREGRDFKESRDVREFKEPRDVREYKEPRDFKYSREFRDAKPVEEPRPARDSRERTPQLEKRFFEYKGERNDKYFDNRYNKHDSRSDDEGVESEKQFEEIRYVQHIEAPRRREPEPRIKSEPIERPIKKEPVRDGRIELLEERQRQIESGRMGRVPAVDDRYDRSQEVPGRTGGDRGEWDPVRRSYAEAERPRRDARARHSYAEPVARTRVGMATVAPF